MRIKKHTATLGLSQSPKRLVATGGGSSNTNFLQIIADVMGSPVYVSGSTNAAAVGAAIRAMHGLRCEEEGGYKPIQHLVKSVDLQAGLQLRLVANPNSAATAVYNKLFPIFCRLEDEIVTRANKTSHL